MMYKHENRSLLAVRSTDEDVMSTIPHIPVFIVDNDGIEHGALTILKRIRPDWDVDKVRIKVKKNQY